MFGCVILQVQVVNSFTHAHTHSDTLYTYSHSVHVYTTICTQSWRCHKKYCWWFIWFIVSIQGIYMFCANLINTKTKHMCNGCYIGLWRRKKNWNFLDPVWLHAVRYQWKWLWPQFIVTVSSVEYKIQSCTGKFLTNHKYNNKDIVSSHRKLWSDWLRSGTERGQSTCVESTQGS